MSSENCYMFRTANHDSQYVQVEFKRPGTSEWLKARKARKTDGYENAYLISRLDQKKVLDSLAADPKGFEEMQKLSEFIRFGESYEVTSVPLNG